jgi:hypothetical protein
VRVVDSWHSENEESSPQSWAARHADGCQACADYFERSEGLERELVEASRRAPVVAMPDGLEDRIWAAVQSEVAVRRAPARSRSRVDWRPVMGGLVAAALIVAVWLGRAPSSEEGLASGQTVATAETLDFNEEDMRELVASVEAFSTELLTASTRETVTPRSVLKQELDALGSDARGALRILSQNFLPSRVRSREEV